MQPYKREYDDRLRWVEKFTYLMDDKFRFPGTQFRFGIDPLLNLIPYAGGFTGLLISGGLVLTMAKYGASHKVVVMMVINIFLDATIGSIPIIGHIFDFFYKANKKNVRMLREHYYEGKHQGSGKNIIAFVMLLLIILFVLFIYLVVQLLQWLFSFF